MFILESICENSSTLRAIYFINNIIEILFIAVPTALVLVLSIDIAKNVLSKDENEIKETLTKGIKRIIYAALLFFVPLIVKVSFNFLGNMGVKYLDCFSLATPESIAALEAKEDYELEQRKEERQKQLEKERLEKEAAILKKKEESAKNREANRSNSGSETRTLGDINSMTDAEVKKALTEGTLKIGQATSGDKGLRNNKAGNQKGGEVSISKFSYSSSNGRYNNWQYMFRAKDPRVALKIAQTMKDCCNNNHIGYDQATPDRGTLYEAAKEKNWNCAAITKNVETTCSEVVLVAINSAIKMPRNKTIESTRLAKLLKKSSDFQKYTASKYLTSTKYLQRGDILISPGKHSAMIV